MSFAQYFNSNSIKLILNKRLFCKQLTTTYVTPIQNRSLPTYFVILQAILDFMYLEREITFGCLFLRSLNKQFWILLLWEKCCIWFFEFVKIIYAVSRFGTLFVGVAWFSGLL